MGDIDYITRKELNELKGEKEAIQGELDADKYMFQHLLEGEMGKKMMEELQNPTKPSLGVGLRNRYRRWKTIKDNKAKARKIKKGGF